MVRTGTTLSGRYRLGDKVAAGGMGTVFQATDERLGREVAVKILAPNLAGEASVVERFRREALAAAGLAHPNIASVFDYGQDEGTNYIVMELVGGRDLSRVLREEGALPPERVAHIVPQICAALGHAHAAGIIHRDVKPGNVIVGDGDRVKVTDFGIARAAGDSKLTATGSVVGTAHYISPEQASGADLTPASDIYSLGIVTYELTTGAVPFTGESLMSVAMRHVNDEVPPPSKIAPDIPSNFDDIVLRATEKDPAQRFFDTAEMAAAFHPADDDGGAGTTAAAGAPGTTAVMGSVQPTVWPIPGDRWDGARLGRRVLIGFAALSLITLALVVWRITTSPTELPGSPPAAERNGAEVQPTTFVMPSYVIGVDHREVVADFTTEGAKVTTASLGGDELRSFLADNEVNPEDADAGEVVGTDPPPGESFSQDRTITLYVSEGLEEAEEGDDGGKDDKDDDKGGPPGHAKNKKGKGKDD